MQGYEEGAEGTFGQCWSCDNLAIRLWNPVGARAVRVRGPRVALRGGAALLTLGYGV